MNERSSRFFAGALCATTLGLLMVALALVVAGSSSALPAGFTSWRGQATVVLGSLGPPVLGALIAFRRPENAYGWLWCGFGMAFALVALGQSYAAFAVTHPGKLPALDLVTMAGNLGWVVGFGLVPFLFLLFPSGRLPSPRWRFLARAVAATVVLLLAVGPFQPGNFGIAPLPNPRGASGAVGVGVTIVLATGVWAIFLATLLSVASLVARFRRASGVERQQIKWFAYAAALQGVLIVFSGLLGRELPGAWHQLLETTALIALYAAVGIAILRYRLYDIDRIINRTLVYGALSAMLIAAYVAVVTAASSLVGESDVTIAAATLAVAALFQPLRRRVQGFIDRRFYRSRYDAQQTVEGFGARLRDAVELDAVTADLLVVVRDALQPAHASLWLRAEGER